MTRDCAYIGLDLGGQSVRGIRLEKDGTVSASARVPTPADQGASAVLETIVGLARSLAVREDVSSVAAAIGIGTPGGVSPEGCITGEASNIPGWLGTPLGPAVSEATGIPCLVRNDANLAAYAEWVARGCMPRALLFVGLGTGIGGGYIEAGRILGGCDDRALEIGHCIVEPAGRLCACGIRGCAEAYASGPSIGRIARDLALRMDAGLGTLSRTLSGTGTESPRDRSPSSACIPEFPREEALSPAFPDSGLAASIRAGLMPNAREVYAAYASGDQLSLQVDDIACEALSRVCASALAMLAPDVLVLGGGVVTGALHLAREVGNRVRALVYQDAWKECSFESARLRSDAGIAGAALLAASQSVAREELASILPREYFR